MELKLNVYKKKEVEKTYTADTYDLMFGTMEDFIEIIDLEKLSDSNSPEFLSAVGTLVTKGITKLKPLLMDIFDGLTEEELRRTKTKDLIKIVMTVLKYSIVEIQGASTGKNA